MNQLNSNFQEQEGDFEDLVESLDATQLKRFQLLFNKKKAKAWWLLAALTGLVAYALVAIILLGPSYGWLVVLVPTLFVVFFIRALFKGIVGESKSTYKDYGSIILPLVLVGLVSVFGGLIWSRGDNITQHARYLEIYADCQRDPSTDAGVDYIYGYVKDCQTLLEGNHHQQVLREYQEEKDQQTRGVIVSGISVIIVYPLSLYYAKSLIDKKNDLLGATIARQVKRNKKS